MSIFVVLLASSALAGALPPAPADAEAAIRTLEAAYVRAWIEDDRQGLMRLFAPDAVLLPSGMPPLRGHDAIRRFWWPDDGSTTTIDSYETRIEQIRASDRMALAWGTGRLAFTWTKDGKASRHSAESTFTAVARRIGGEWTFVHRAWSNVRSTATPIPVPSSSRDGDSLVEKAKRFRAFLEARETTAARAMLAPDPRRWWESREGEGQPWTLGPAASGPWAAWDEHFRSERETVGWRADERSATVTVRETNDFFRLLERPPVLNEITYFFDGDGRIEGLLIRAAGDRPPGRTEEFRAWARANAPDELEAVMPGGEIDPSDPARFRRLLERWRSETTTKGR